MKPIEWANFSSFHDKFKIFRMQSLSVRGKNILHEKAKFKSSSFKVFWAWFQQSQAKITFFSNNFFPCKFLGGILSTSKKSNITFSYPSSKVVSSKKPKIVVGHVRLQHHYVFTPMQNLWEGYASHMFIYKQHQSGSVPTPIPNCFLCLQAKLHKGI